MERVNRLFHFLYQILFSLYAPIFIVYVIANYALVAIYDYLEHYPAVRSVFLLFGAAFIFITSGLLIRSVYRLYKERKSREMYGCPHVELISSDVALTIKPDDVYLFTRRLVIKALQSGVTGFHTKFDYRGTKDEFAINQADGADIKTERSSDSGEYIVYMTFTPALKKGEERNVMFEITIHDRRRIMGPFFGHSCSFPVRDYIRQDVIFDGVEAPISANEKVFAVSYVAATKVKPTIIANNRIGQVVRKPRLGFRYVLDWKFR